MLIEGEGLKKQGGGVYIGRAEGSSAMAMPLEMFPEQDIKNYR